MAANRAFGRQQDHPDLKINGKAAARTTTMHLQFSAQKHDTVHRQKQRCGDINQPTSKHYIKQPMVSMSAINMY
uniref:Uncharacterized protein n=1 Tax=Oryza brachyantha TaxID=4533 RepID=J3N1Z8_ORYBR